MVDLGVCGGSSYIAGSGRLYLPRVNGIGLYHREGTETGIKLTPLSLSTIYCVDLCVMLTHYQNIDTSRF